MANDKTVSFKVFLTIEGSNEKPEVRRFGIDRDVVCSFTYLHQKLQQVFPTLKGKNFTVAWRDADGDEITITSDEDLIIALTEMQTDVRKIYVILQTKPISKSDKTSSEHFGIVCDNCESNVSGFRYKCIQCPDYDLCSSCEAAGSHPQHNMIRIPVPRRFRPYFNRRLARLLSRTSTLDDRCPFQTDLDSGCEESGEKEKGCPYVNHHRRHSVKKFRKGNEACFEQMDCSGDESDVKKKHHKHRHNRHSRDHTHGVLGDLINTILGWDQTEYSDPAGPSTSQNTDTQNSESGHVKYLRAIGKTVANLLDPLGVDVDVEIKQKDGSGEKVQSDNKMKNSTDTEMKDGTKVDNAESSPKDVNETPVFPCAKVRFGVPEQEASHSPGPSTEQNYSGTLQQLTDFLAQQKISETSERDGWTMLNTDQGVQNTESVLQVPPSAPVGPSVKENVNQNQVFGSMYPKLTQSSETTTNLHQQSYQQPRHSNPIIADSIDKMMSMGFSNEGGWLTQLMETKGGDIYKALDVLQPVKK